MVSVACFSQVNPSITQTDMLVASINRKAKTVEKFRWLLGYVSYGRANDSALKIVHFYKAGPREITETFYVHDSSLVFATKQATSYYFYGDSTVLLGKYYFENNSLKYYALYHDEDENDSTHIQEDVLNQYQHIISIIARHKK